jgi:hypothetical protein
MTSSTTDPTAAPGAESAFAAAFRVPLRPVQAP